MKLLCGLFDDNSSSHKRIETLFPNEACLGFSNNNHSCATINGDFCEPEQGVSVAYIGNPYFTKSIEKEFANSEGFAKQLRDLYLQKDKSCLQEVLGAFALVIMDANKNRLIVALDRIGQFAMYYGSTENGLMFGTTLRFLHSVKPDCKQLSMQNIFNYMYFHMVPSPQTIYESISKLPGGHYLEYSKNNCDVKSYWQPEFKEQSTDSVESLSKQLREAIHESVGRLNAGEKVGSFLSGGLDSSTVTGMLSNIQEGGSQAFSIGFDEKDYNEIEYARLVAKHFNVNLNEYFVTPEDVIDAIPKIAAYYDEPFGNSSALPTYYCAKFAKENGVTRLLAGDGGDELFAGNERYAKQKLFEFYGFVPPVLRKILFEKPFSSFSKLQSLPLLSKLHSYVQQANIPLPDRLETYNFLHRQALEEIFNSTLLDQVQSDYPESLLRDLYQQPQEAKSLNRMMYLDWQRTLHDNDLMKVNKMCEMGGVEVVYPFLDDAVVNFSTQIPSHLKLKGQNLRWFYKEAMKGFLPDAVLTKSKHGFGLPFGLWMRANPKLQSMAYDSVFALKERDFFAKDFLESAVEMHRSGHAAYYGELIWVLMMLSQWLHAHEH